VAAQLSHGASGTSVLSANSGSISITAYFDPFAPTVMLASSACCSYLPGERDNMAGVYSVHATKKLLARLKEPVRVPVVEPTTRLGNWYAKPLFWKPQFVLFVNERTFLPVLVPLAPASTLLRRFPGVLASTLEAHGVRRSFIDAQVNAMATVELSKTQSRQLIGVLNELAFHVDIIRHEQPDPDELEIAMEASRVPMGILGKSYRFPDLALAELVDEAGDVD
jgi:hypothetical protein